jgi:succinate dehydrogenase/fumarate reductase flavoprotein subunit
MECDVVVLGTGAAGLAAAVTAAHAGLSVIVLERDHMIGGTSAISGGAIWIPGTRQAVAGGFKDSLDNARLYLRNVLAGCYNAELVETFLARGPEALAFLEDNTELRYTVRELSPDYYPEIQGATDSGRALEVAEYDGKKLGRYFELLRAPPAGMMVLGGMMVNKMDIHHLLNMRKSLESFIHCVKLVARFVRDRLTYPRGTRLVIGNAMVARLLKSALDKGVKFHLNAETTSFLMSADGRVEGVAARLSDHTTAHIRTTGGVILATGGLSRNPQVLGDRPDTGEDHLSMASPKSDGTMMYLGEKLGAQLGGGLLSNFYWAPMSAMIDEDGRKEIFPHIVTDRAKPGIIAVTDKGVRFVNEANSYHRFVEAMRAELRQGTSRFYLIADSKALKSYGLGLARPSPGINTKLVRNGYLIEAATIEALAMRLNIAPSSSLQTTINEFNRDAAVGVDPQFQKGASSYNRAMGDPGAAHPCLAPIAVPPFYAVRIVTGDLGSAKGLVTDANTRVQKRDGSIIPGLYAVGSDMNSVMAGGYPGPGITLGPALTFGYVAAKTILEETHVGARQRAT